jgi:hypothetical protein
MKRLAFLLALFVASCGTQFSDPIQRHADEEPVDRCAAKSNESECLAEPGCTFQPNSPGCDPAEPSCPAGTCRGGDPFVRRSGDTLLLHDAPYRFVGTVSWGLAWSDACRVTSLDGQEEALSRAFTDLSRMRASVLKVWAFQSFAGDDGRDYASFERIVDAARRAGVRLIFVLENHHADCTTGGARDDAWYAGGYDAPYGDYSLSYSEYVLGLVEHFRDEPTILAWELMHEAHGEDFTALETFTQAITTLVRSRDPNHLIALGTDSGDSRATSRSGTPSNYECLHAYPGIDLLDVHDFFEDTVPFRTSLRDVSAIARTLDKPVFAGATAVDLTGTTPSDFDLRARRVEDKLVAATDAGFAGFLVYDYYPDWSDVGRQFDGRPEEPLAGPDGVLSRHAPPNE